MGMPDLKAFIRDVPDFPKKGIVFKDVTTLLKNAEAFREAVHALSEPHHEHKPDAIVGIESRGFILGGAMAYRLGVPFVPARKQGKLPAETVRQEYTLEYGKDAIEIHRDAIQKGMRVLIVDDLLATGGTASATVRLVQKLGGIVVGTAFLIELTFLNGRNKLKNVPVDALIRYSTE
jgi:adenine phosphoribosyltransferase